MARITVTDCLEHVESRFQLVLIASKRARQLLNGAPSMLPDSGNKPDKPTVMALREIADGLVGPEILRRDAEIPGLLDGINSAQAMPANSGVRDFGTEQDALPMSNWGEAVIAHSSELSAGENNEQPSDPESAP